MIKKFNNYRIVEELTYPYEEGTPLVYRNYYLNNIDGFNNEILNDLKEKLIGKTVLIDAIRIYNRWNNERDPIDNIKINGVLVKPYYKITVKDVIFNGSTYGGIYLINLIDVDGKSYHFKRIITQKVYDNFFKKFQKELDRIEEEKRKKERLKLKHIGHDPYGEENWEDDD